MEYNYIAILLTENCNACCKMCCDSRGNVKGHTLTIDELNLILKQIQECSFVETVGITGGEPMLYSELCEYIINYDFGRKINFTIKTNGYWGNNIEKAREFLQKYSHKISKISFSYDEFHREFIDLNYIKNIIKLCIEYKIKTDIVGCFLENGMQPGDILNELGIYAYLTEFYYQPVINTGSAKKIKGARFVPLINTKTDELRCLVTAKGEYALLINARLEVYPCCSQCVENTILNVGNLKNKELKNIIEDIKCNKIFNTLFVEGFSPFIKFMEENNICYPETLSSPCEICEYLFSTEWFLKEIERGFMIIYKYDEFDIAEELDSDICIMHKEFNFYRITKELKEKFVEGEELRTVKTINDNILIFIIMMMINVLTLIIYLDCGVYTLVDNQVIIATFFLLANVLLHEFGHVLFLKVFYKEAKIKIGFKFIFIYPAFFVDTSFSYLCPKYKRISIYLAGNFINCIFVLIVYIFFPQYLKYCYIIISNIIINFIPIIKSDGYYALMTILDKYNISKINKKNLGDDFLRGLIMFIVMLILSYIY